MTKEQNTTEQIALQSHLAEYEAIWGEVHTQISMQSNILNYVIALIAASAALFTIGDPSIAERIPWLILVASLLLLSMVWALIDASYQLNDIGAYTDQVLGRKIQILIGEDVPFHLQVMQWNKARIYRGGRIFLKGLLAAGKFAFAYIPALVLIVAFYSIRPPSQVHWTKPEILLFMIAILMASVPVIAGVNNSLFIRRREPNLFAALIRSSNGEDASPSTHIPPNPSVEATRDAARIPIDSE